MEIPGAMSVRWARGRRGSTMVARRVDGAPFGGLAATEAGQRGRRFWLKSDRCVLRSGDAFVPAGAVVGPTCDRRGSLGCACGGRGRPRRFARHSPRPPRPYADAVAPDPVPICSAVAFAGRTLGLLPARHLPGGRRSGDLRSGLPPGTFARGGTGAAGRTSIRAEYVSGLHDVPLLRRRCSDLPPLLGRHDALQLRPRRLRRPGWRERAGGSSLHGDGPRRDGLAAGRIPFPDRAERGVRLCGPSRGGGSPGQHDTNDAVLPGPGGLRHQGGRGPPPRLASARTPCGPKPCVGADVGRHAQGRDLRDSALRLRSPRPSRRAAPALLGVDGAGRGHDLGRARGALRAPAARPQAPARVSQCREHWDHPHRSGTSDDSVAPGWRERRPCDRRAHRRTPSHRQPRCLQRTALPRRGQRSLPHAHPQH